MLRPCMYDVKQAGGNVPHPVCPSGSMVKAYRTCPVFVLSVLYLLVTTDTMGRLLIKIILNSRGQDEWWSGDDDNVGAGHAI
eukprot:scaffold20284_cov72-Attheya_sp.AAC.1